MIKMIKKAIGLAIKRNIHIDKFWFGDSSYIDSVEIIYNRYYKMDSIRYNDFNLYNQIENTLFKESINELLDLERERYIYNRKIVMERNYQLNWYIVNANRALKNRIDQLKFDKNGYFNMGELMRNLIPKSKENKFSTPNIPINKEYNIFL